MTKPLTILVFLISLITFGQTKMRKVEELLNKEDPAWPFINEWINSAKNKVEVLPANPKNTEDALYKTQVTTRSPMGAIIYMTGGILIDHGWIRILGSGSEKLNRSFPMWNKGKAFNDFGQNSPFLLIADDVIGGFFLLNGGGLGDDLGKVYYFAPGNLEFEPLNLTYTEFLNFCFNDNLEEFYKDYRWEHWKDDVEKLKGDQVYNFFPYLWTKEGKDIDMVSRKAIQADEQYNLNINFRKQLGLTK